MAAFGAELTLVHSEDGRFTKKLFLDMIEAAGEISRRPRTYWTDQLTNADAVAGYHSMGEEIWRRAGGTSVGGDIIGWRRRRLVRRLELSHTLRLRSGWQDWVS